MKKLLIATMCISSISAILSLQNRSDMNKITKTQFEFIQEVETNLNGQSRINNGFTQSMEGVVFTLKNVVSLVGDVVGVVKKLHKDEIRLEGESMNGKNN